MQQERRRWHFPAAMLLVLQANVLHAGVASASEAKPMCGGKPATIVGTPGKDKIVGTSGGDVIAGLGGDDRIEGLEGNDTLCGGAGYDFVLGGEGDDLLLDRGFSVAEGGPGNDRIRGFNSAVGGPGDDVIRPGRKPWPFSAQYSGDEGDDLVVGGDHYTDVDGPDQLHGGPGNDRLLGRGERDDLFPGPGDDYVDGGSGVLNSLHLFDAKAPLYVDITRGEAREELFGSDLDEDLFGSDLDVDRFVRINHVLGGPYPDYMLGDERRDHFHGCGGSDRIYGFGGRDYLSGGPLEDLLPREGCNGPYHETDLLVGGAEYDICPGGSADVRLECESTS